MTLSLVFTPRSGEDEGLAAQLSSAAHAQVPLRDHYDARLVDFWRALDERQLRIDAVFSEHKLALELARAELELRLEKMNEFRLQLEKQAATFVSDDALGPKLDAIEGRISALERHQSWTIGYMLGAAAIVGLVQFVVMVWLRDGHGGGTRWM